MQGRGLCSRSMSIQGISFSGMSSGQEFSTFFSRHEPFTIHSVKLHVCARRPTPQSCVFLQGEKPDAHLHTSPNPLGKIIRTSQKHMEPNALHSVLQEIFGA